jgi:hypothetical protein
LSRHGLFIPTGRKKNGIQMWHDGESINHLVTFNIKKLALMLLIFKKTSSFGDPKNEI